jgi:hypothetical protein
LRAIQTAEVTAERYQVGTVLCVQNKDMKQAWCLAASDGAASAASLKALYGKRWSIECGLRDTKDLRFGMGMGSIHAGAARPAVADRRIRRHAADPARGRRGSARLRPIPQVKHRQAANPFAVPPGLHAIRVAARLHRGACSQTARIPARISCPILRPRLSPPTTLRAIRYRALLRRWAFRPSLAGSNLPSVMG